MIWLASLLFAIAFGTGLLGLYQILVRDRDPVVSRLRDLRSRALASRPDQSAPKAPVGLATTPRSWFCPPTTS